MEQHIDDQRLAIGRRIKTARNLAGISRKDLERHGISMHTLQSWELGRNPLTEKAAAKLVEIFHETGVSCSSQWLLQGAGKSPRLLGEEFVAYSPIDKAMGSPFTQENRIQKEIDFFKLNNPNAIVMMVADDCMEPVYSKGDVIGGIQYLAPADLEQCLGHDCIVEISDGIFFRRLIKRTTGYALACLNAQTTLAEPVLFTKKILAATPIIWHRWTVLKPS